MLSLLRGRNLFGSLVLVLLVVALAALNPSPARAVSYAWNVASGNWDQAGNWTPGGGPPGSAASDDGTISSGLATANAQLGNSANILVNGTGIVEINSLATSATAGTFDVASGGRLQWRGTSTGTTAVTLLNGATFGKREFTVLAVGTDNLTIDPNATVTASLIFSTVSRASLGLRLDGSLTGNATTTLVVNPSTAVANNKGSLVLNPSSANTGFLGDVELTGFGANLGTLVLTGTGALSNVGSIAINSGGQLRLANATDPLPAGFLIDVLNGGRIEWEGTQTYNIAPPTITLRDGAQFGREDSLGVPAVSTEAITIDSGATVTASRINDTVSRASRGLQLTGSLTGDNTTTLAVNPSTAAVKFTGSLVLNPSSANTGFLGDVELTGFGANLGTLVLTGTGALSNVGSIAINTGGQYRRAQRRSCGMAGHANVQHRPPNDHPARRRGVWT